MAARDASVARRPRARRAPRPLHVAARAREGRPLRIVVEDLELCIDGAPPEVEAGLLAVWYGTRGDGTIPLHVAVRREGARHALRIDGVDREDLVEEESLLPTLELVLYDAIADHLSRRATILHAGAVRLDGRLCVFVGESGGGKSSHVLEALRAGATYLTDELLLTDGRSVWGIPRAVQFDLVPVGTPLIPRLSDLDVTSYRCVDLEGRKVALPIFHVPEERIERTHGPLQEAIVFLVRPDRDEALVPLSPALALARVLAVVNHEPVHDVGGLVGAGRAFELGWTDPRSSIARVRDLLADRRGSRTA